MKAFKIGQITKGYQCAKASWPPKQLICCQSLHAAKLPLTDHRSSRVQASKIPLSIWCQDISSTSYRSCKLWLRMGWGLFQHFLQHPAAVDGKSHHHQNVVSLLSNYHHVNFAVWVLPFSIISLYLLIDPTYNMEVIFFWFWLNGVNIHFFFLQASYQLLASLSV